LLGYNHTMSSKRGFLLFAAVLSLQLFVSGCQSQEEKMDAVEQAGVVEYNGNKYPVGRVNRKNMVVFIKEKDGMLAPVPLEAVTPAQY
jgi:hypothetical protein